MHNLFRLLILGSLGVPTIATYLQSAACPGYSLNAWTAGANYTIKDARLDHSHENGVLSFVLGRSLSPQECQALPANAIIDLSITRSGSTLAYQAETQAQCTAPEAHPARHQVRLPVTVDLGSVSPFLDIGVIFKTTLEDEGQVSCLMANIIPAPRATTRLQLRWIPFGVCAFVLLVSAFRTMAQVQPTLDRPSQLAPEILPGASECLLYFQFAFLSGTLTLSYPGFSQPILSHLNMFSLFNPGPLAHGHAYSSIEDGIYTMNGTYGGTLGFELMHQIVGVPHTADTWRKMIIAVLILAVFIAVVLEMRLFFTGNREHSTTCARGGFNRRFSTILKAVFSYFTLPICALTFYQTNYARHMPVYHTTFALITVIVVLLAFVWLFRQSPADGMGDFVIGRPKQSSAGRKTSRISTSHERGFVAAHFVIIFVRGAVIGSLQRFPEAQLAMLMLCELGLFLAMLRLRPDQLWTTRLASTVARVATLALLCCFLPELTDGRLKSIAGFAIVILHASVLGLLFFLPAMFHLVMMVWNHFGTSKPNAYGLRQLNRRSRRTSKWGSTAETSSLEESSISSDGQLEDKPETTILGASLLTLRPTSFFRQPSRSSFTPITSVLQGSNSSLDANDTLSPPTSNLSVPLQNLEKATVRANLDTSVHRPGNVSPESLGPRWNDFTFRESDLIYGSPFRKQELKRTQEARSQTGLLARFKKSSLLHVFWRRNVQAAEESNTGFHVVRASRPEVEDL
ncbi:hypothetical protein M409DRAFT_26148 [Zasmidium cellare ATCC 36951]|uniref:TRP C-terminal domain-containing protein n=1 Tax=Zasmidium cellare ATCC 36951 TaxID=1080233 RepID=A0A6A6C8N0_ZASCE|nr:uncharacterized protein M409DRAFT_26148 [Zasmidium cellare ATCC 36951]KAF2163537.1 hypothetical protein M409DRAFT_26148 [Zasmidium cellare ATCC 36951]